MVLRSAAAAALAAAAGKLLAAAVMVTLLDPGRAAGRLLAVRGRGAADRPTRWQQRLAVARRPPACPAVQALAAAAHQRHGSAWLAPLSWCSSSRCRWSVCRQPGGHPLVTLLAIVPLALLATRCRRCGARRAGAGADGGLRALAAWLGGQWTVAAAAPCLGVAAGLAGGAVLFMPRSTAAAAAGLPLMLPL